MLREIRREWFHWCYLWLVPHSDLRGLVFGIPGGANPPAGKS